MRQFIFVLLCLSVVACSSDKKEKPTGVIPEHQLQALEKAKETEDLMKKKMEEANKQIEDASK